MSGNACDFHLLILVGSHIYSSWQFRPLPKNCHPLAENSHRVLHLNGRYQCFMLTIGRYQFLIGQGLRAKPPMKILYPPAFLIICTGASQSPEASEEWVTQSHWQYKRKSALTIQESPSQMLPSFFMRALELDLSSKLSPNMHVGFKVPMINSFAVTETLKRNPHFAAGFQLLLSLGTWIPMMAAMILDRNLWSYHRLVFARADITGTALPKVQWFDFRCLACCLRRFLPYVMNVECGIFLCNW